MCPIVSGKSIMVLRMWSTSCDLCVLAGPVRIAQLALEDLAGRRLGQRLGTQLDAPGDLESGDLLAAVRDQLVGSGVPAAEHHGVDRLAPARMGHAEDGYLLDAGIAGQRVLHLGGVDVLA